MANNVRLIDVQKGQIMAVALANERISLRTTAEAKHIMEQAARLTGTTLSAFMIQNAYERALDLLAQHRAIQLDAAQWQQLQRLIEAQPAANPELQELLHLGASLVQD